MGVLNEKRCKNNIENNDDIVIESSDDEDIDDCECSIK